MQIVALTQILGKHAGSDLHSYHIHGVLICTNVAGIKFGEKTWVNLPGVNVCHPGSSTSASRQRTRLFDTTSCPDTTGILIAENDVCSRGQTVSVCGVIHNGWSVETNRSVNRPGRMYLATKRIVFPSFLDK